MRSKAEKRHNDRIKKERRKNIAFSLGYNEEFKEDIEAFFFRRGKDSFGKRKTRNKNRRHVYGNYAPSINYSPSDQRKIDAMDYDDDDDAER